MMEALGWPSWAVAGRYSVIGRILNIAPLI